MSIDLKELEVKILDIDIEEMKHKLSELGAEFIEESFQKIQTYDFYDVSTRYNAIISEIDKKPEHVSINRLKSLFNEINQCLSKDNLSLIKKIVDEGIYYAVLIKNQKLVCEKSLLTEGTIGEFEAKFKDKIIKK
jgi:adenylate cyclase class IV